MNRRVLYSPCNLVFKKVDDFYLVLYPDIPNLMVVEELGKRVFDLCDGTRDMETILQCIGLKNESENIRNFISSLLSGGFLSTKPFSPPKKEAKYPTTLVKLIMNLTNSCNLRCKHCYASAGAPLKDELEDHEFLRLIEQFAELKGEQLVITGGEPFLKRKLLYQMIKKAREHGIKKIYVETNGTLITSEDAETCKKYEVEIGVSLDGAKPETHSYIRGPDAYEKAIKGIQALVDAQVKVVIGMTLMQHNMNEVEEIVHLAKKLQAQYVTFSMVRMMGRATQNPQLTLNANDAISALKQACEASKKAGMNVVIEEQYPELKMLTKRDRCGVGVSVLSIASNGDVYPCNMFHNQAEFKAGNIREQSLEEIWKNSAVLRKLWDLSVLDVPECHDCELKFICFCCPAESFLAHGDLNRRPPQCPIYKELFWSYLEDLARKLWRES